MHLLLRALSALAPCVAAISCMECDEVASVRMVNLPSLKPYWWADPSFYNITEQRVREMSKALAVDNYCLNERHVFWKLEGHNGGTCNFLMEFSKYLMLLRHGPKSPGGKMHVPILPTEYGKLVGLDTLDWRRAIMPWMCIVRKVNRKKIPPESILAPNAFHFPRPPGMRANWMGTIITHLLTSPTTSFQEKIERFQKEQLWSTAVDQPIYVGIHLRSLQNSCLKRFEKAGITKDPRWEKTKEGRELHPKDMCRMSTPLIRWYLRCFDSLFHSSGVSSRDVKIYVAHDGQQSSELSRISSDFEGHIVTTPQGLEKVSAVMFDMCMLIRSSFFIGNGVSSFSGVVASVRQHLLGNDIYSKYTNMPARSILK